MVSNSCSGNRSRETPQPNQKQQKNFPRLLPSRLSRRPNVRTLAAIGMVLAVVAIPLRGLFLSTGYSGHGFGLGPAAGRLTADLVTGDPPIVDPRPFRLSRFG